MEKLFIILIVLFFSFFTACEDEEKENQLPTCAITYPNNGDEFKRGNTIAISVEANDNDGSIAEVDFYIDNIRVFSSNSFPYGYSWNTLDETIGNHIIKVTAKDDDGGSQTDECTISIIGNATVVTTEASSVTHNSATSGGNVTNDGGASILEKGVCWNTSQNPTLSNDHTIDGSGLGSFTSSLTGLTQNTTYYVKAYATNSTGTAYGNEVIFITDISGGTITDYDGNTYNTVQIGNQMWMAENLKATHYPGGTSIQLVEDSLAWDALGYTGKAYCYYNNNSSNEETYGALYTWAAAMNGASSSDANPSGVQGVCPDGWHLPSDAEWKELEMHLGMSQAEADEYGNRGSGEGGKLKETGTTHWNSPNTGATNESGFTALPGGFRSDYGEFVLIGYYGNWWSSTEYHADYTWAWDRNVGYSVSNVHRGNPLKKFGFSVRCVKDD